LLINAGDHLKKLVLFKVGSKDAQLPKLIGAFLIVISVLMLVQSGAVMFDSWQAIRGFDTCIIDSYKSSQEVPVENGIDKLVYELKVSECKDALYEISGAQIPGGVYSMSLRQMATAFLGPVSNFFVWAIVFLFALFLFNNASVVVPVEQVEIPLRTSTKTKKKSKKKKK
jgi:hypothetical protein